MALHRQAAVKFTARSYLLAGFTAASIVAAGSLAPRPTVNLPKIHFAEVRLAAAETELAASDLGPLVGDVAALDFDLLGTPFAGIAASSFAANLAISDLSSGLLGDIPGDVYNSLQFGIGSRLNLLVADLSVLTDEVNHLSGIINPASTSTSAANAGSAVTQTRAVDPTAVGPLAGDAVQLGVDVAAAPFELAESLTNALSAASLDLGAGQFQDATQDFASDLRLGFVEAQTRLGTDLSGIAASLARLTGATPASTVADKPAAAKTAAQAVSVADSKKALTKAGATAPVPARHRAETAGDTKPATGSATTSRGASDTKTDTKTNTREPSSPGQQHSTPGKHRASSGKHHKH